MRKTKLGYAATLLSFILLMALPSYAFAATKTVTVDSKAVSLQFDGKNLSLPAGQVAFMYDSRIYIPLRFVSYALQKNVVWDGKNATVTVSEPTSSQAVVLKEYLMNAATASGKTQTAAGKVKVTPVAVKLLFDGIEKKLPTGQQAFNSNGTIYVPVRFMSEAVGTTIGWDAKTGLVTGQSKAYLEAQKNGGGQSSTGTGSTGSNGEGSGSTGGTGGTGATTKPTYEQITSSAYSQLDTLRNSCKTQITNIGANYVLETNAAKKEALKNQANTILASCKASFSSIMSDTESKLKANGYSTDILNEYRATFEAELKAGEELANSVLN